MQCPNLEHLYVADCQRLTDASLKFLTMSRNLVVANFADCVRISDKGVRQLVEGPAGIKLRELNLTNCIRVGDIAMVNIHKRYCTGKFYQKSNTPQNCWDCSKNVSHKIYTCVLFFHENEK